MTDAPGPPLEIAIARRLRLCRVPPALRERLVRELTVENPKWLENERLGRWNQGVPRRLTFFTETRGGGLSLPRGFIRPLIRICREMGIPHTLADRRRTLPEVDFAFRGGLKPFQETAATAMLAKEFGVLCAPTGAGKTVVALHLAAKRRQPTLIVVHTRDLAHQWIDRVGGFLGIGEAEIGLIGEGRKDFGAGVTVALIQSLYKCAEEASRHTGYLIVDECHRIPSRTFTEAVTAFDCRYMMGLSATPFRRDKLSQLIYWHLGDLHHRVAPEELVDQGHILRADVIFRETAFVPYHDPSRDYSKMLSELTADDDRNHLIAADAAREAAGGQGTILVLSDRKKHCEMLRAILKHRHGVPSELMTGDVPLARRREILGRINAGEVRVLVATGQLIGEGFDCPDLSTLFITTPIRFSGRVIQYLGRILRPGPGKPRPRVFDYVDSQVGPLAWAAEKRRKVYTDAGMAEASPQAEGPAT